MVGDRLEALRAGLDGCTLAAVGDLSSGLILRTSSEARQRQEVLDELCGVATRLLDSETADDIAALLGVEAGLLGEAVVELAGERRVFVRNVESDDELFCCLWMSGGTTDAAIAAARSALLDISAAA